MNLRPIKILNNLYFKFEDIFKILEVEGIVSIKAGRNQTIDILTTSDPDTRENTCQGELSPKEINHVNNVTQSDKNKSLNLSIENTWARAAKEGKREIFMNTLRPIMRKKLSFEFTEILLEEKAKLLCFRWYESKDKGEEYKGPFLIEDI
ncbi:MAG: hypothetical protein CME61_05550 [Halobacteriovoraceae bacterium]|nr:hypothetical protein [Halobacteriovoraceae bacterium]